MTKGSFSLSLTDHPLFLVWPASPVCMFCLPWMSLAMSGSRKATCCSGGLWGCDMLQWHCWWWSPDELMVLSPYFVPFFAIIFLLYEFFCACMHAWIIFLAVEFLLFEFFFTGASAPSSFWTSQSKAKEGTVPSKIEALVGNGHIVQEPTSSSSMLLAGTNSTIVVA